MLNENKNRNAAMEVARLVKSNGGRAFFVGGCVRDMMLGFEPKDFDVEVFGLEAGKLRAVLESEFRVDAVGESFGVFKLAHLDVDVALPRSESKMSPNGGHKDFFINSNPNLSFEEACSRRDFTMNAILVDPLNGETIDPFNGREDLNNRVLRHVSDKFAEDPLRVLRAMQLAARFSLSVHPSTVELCASMSANELPRERLAVEWEKLLLKGEKLSLGLEFLNACGWLRFFPELLPLLSCEQSPKHHPEGNVWEHTLYALDALPHVRSGNAEDDLLVAVAVLCHDFGKPVVSKADCNGVIKATKHEHAAHDKVRSFVERLWNKRGFADEVVRLVDAHMRPFSLVRTNGSDKAFRRLSADVPRLDLLAKVAECDTRARPPLSPDLRSLEKFLARANSLSVLKEPIKPIIGGRHMIALGLKPSPRFKPILDIVFDKQINGEFKDEAGGIEVLKAVLFTK